MPGLVPETPTPEGFVGLPEHHDMAGVALSELRTNLVATLRFQRWDVERVREMAATYGTKAIAALIEECIAEAHGTAASCTTIPTSCRCRGSSQTRRAWTSAR